MSGSDLFPESVLAHRPDPPGRDPLVETIGGVLVTGNRPLPNLIEP